jgi:hypothetical protein
MATPSASARRRRLVAAEASKYGGVVSRCILRELGVDHRAVAREVAADRWRMLGRQTVATHLGTLPVEATGGGRSGRSARVAPRSTG